MNITSEEWMQLATGVIDGSGSYSGKNIDQFFWEKYCSLYHKVSSYLKKIENKMFSQPTDMIHRILLHRTQEFDGLGAKIGIPLAFKLKNIDSNATFTYEGESYGDCYYFDRYITVKKDEIQPGQAIRVGKRVNVILNGRPIGTVTSINDDSDSVKVQIGEELRDISYKDLLPVDTNEDEITKNQKVIAIREARDPRPYVCKVISISDDEIRVKILQNQGYPGNIISDLSETRVTIMEDTFKKVFASFEEQLYMGEDMDTSQKSEVIPRQLVQNIIKFLGRDKIRLSRLKKSTLKELENEYYIREAKLEIDDSLFNDLPVQGQNIFTDAIPNFYLRLEDLTQFGISGTTPKKSGWFKNQTKVSYIRPAFIKLAKTMTTLQAMEDAFMDFEFLKERLAKTVEAIIGWRPSVKNLSKSNEMLLDLNQLFNYSYESLKDYYEGDELKKFIRKQINPFRDLFDCREVDLDIDLDISDESDDAFYESTDFDSDEEDVTKLIPERNARSQSDLRESQLIQWPLGEFKYWQKVKDVVDELIERSKPSDAAEEFNTGPLARQIHGKKTLDSNPLTRSEEIFRARVACMLTSNGRDFLEQHFEDFCLPTRIDLLRMSDTLRLSLNDIFLVLLLRFYNLNELGGNYNECRKQLSRVVVDILDKFFSGLNTTFIPKNEILQFTFQTFGNNRIRLKRAFFQPLLRKLSGKTVQDFKQRLETQLSSSRETKYKPVCLLYSSNLKKNQETAKLRYYLKQALQVGVYLTKHFKTSRHSSELFFDLFKVLLENNIKLTIQQRKDLVQDTTKLAILDTEIRRTLYLKRRSRNKAKRERALQYHSDKRDTLIFKWLRIYIEIIRKITDNPNRKQFYLCDTIISLIALNCVASFEDSNLDYLLQTVFINFLERGTLDLGSYVHMWFFGKDDVQNHWIRCKDKTTIEVLSLSRFAEIDSKFCMLNTDKWDDLTRSNVFIVTPNSKWGQVKGYNCNQHNLYMSYDIESKNESKKQKKKTQQIQNFNMVHNPISSHKEQSKSISFSPFQMEAFKQKKMTGTAWSIGDLLGQTVVHIGSEFFLTFNNIFGCLSNKNYMPFEKFKQIGRDKDDLQNKMYTLFQQLYNVRNDSDITVEEMKKKFFENVGFIKSNYASLDLGAKLPRHNYVIKVLEFLELLQEFAGLVIYEDSHVVFLKKVCTKLLNELQRSERRDVGAKISVNPALIKKLGDMFFSERIQIKSKIWAKNYKWTRDGVIKEKEPESFRIQRLVELILMADFATTNGIRDYRYRFHERLNKLNLAFSYMFSTQREWATEHKYFEKLRKQNITLDCSHWYLEIPQCNPIVELSHAICPLKDFFGSFQKSYNSIILRMLDVFDFQLRLQKKEQLYTFSLNDDVKKDILMQDINSIIDDIEDFIDSMNDKINDDIDKEIGFFTTIGYYKKKLNDAEYELHLKETYDAVGDELDNLERDVKLAQADFDKTKTYLGRPLFEFIKKMLEFASFLTKIKDGEGQEETIDLTNDEAELRDDLLQALTFPFIKEKYGPKLIKIVNSDLKINGPMISIIVEGLMKSLLKRLEVLEPDDEDDTTKVSTLLRTGNTRANPQQVKNFLLETNLSELTSAMRNLYDTLFDYFDDFDSTPVLSNLILGQVELEALRSNIEEIDKKLQSEYEKMQRGFQYYIDYETLIADLQFAGMPYVLYGNNIRLSYTSGEKKRLDEIFNHDEEVKYDEDEDVLNAFKTRYENIEAIRSDQWKINKADLKKLKLPRPQKLLRTFLNNFSFTMSYQAGTEGNREEVLLSSLDVVQPVWFREMKTGVAKKLEEIIDEYRKYEEFRTAEDIKYFEQLQKLWNGIHKPSNRIRFKSFCQKVMQSRNDTFRSDLNSIIRKNQPEVESFFNIYFKGDGLFKELIAVMYAKNWFNQLKQVLKDEIRLQHKAELEICEEKLNKVKNLRSSSFNESFKSFYNCLVDALQKNEDLIYLFQEMEPFTLDIELKTGFSLNLEVPTRMDTPWLTKMIVELQSKIEILTDDGSSSSDQSFSFLNIEQLSTTNFFNFLQELQVFKHSRKQEIMQIIAKYRSGIERDTNVQRFELRGDYMIFSKKILSESGSSSSDSDRSSYDSDSSSSDSVSSLPELQGSYMFSDQGSSSDSDSSKEELFLTPKNRPPAESDKDSPGNELLLGESFSETIVETGDVDQDDEIPESSNFDQFRKSLEARFSATQNETRFIKEFFHKISCLISKINPVFNTEMVLGDTFSSALDVLKGTLNTLFDLIRSDLEFLKALETVIVPDVLKHLQYREDNRTNNMFYALAEMIEETILGEFYWTQAQKAQGGKAAKITKTFRSYLKDSNQIQENQIDELKKYERVNGITEPFLVRLEEVNEVIEDSADSEAKDQSTSTNMYTNVSVHKVSTSLVDTIQFILTTTFGLDIKKRTFENVNFTNNIFKFSDILSYVKNDGENPTPANKHISDKLANMIQEVYDQLDQVVSLKYKEAQKQYDRAKYEVYLKAAAKSIILVYCETTADTRHFFVWGEDLKCAICQKDMYDEIHITEATVTIGDSRSKKDFEELYDLFDEDL